MKHLILLILSIFIISCDNDDSNASNQNICVYDGLTYLDNNQTNEVLIPSTNLTTEYYPNSNGPGIPAIEIYKTDDISMVFTTNIVTLNATGVGSLIINNGPPVTVNVACQRAGTQVGDEFRFDLTASGLEAEFCVTIDAVNP